MEFLKINGGFGEGGGQIVRTALTLSCITKKPIVVENIRKNRSNPGLKAQHVTAIKILQKICNAKTEGVAIGSTSFRFSPENVREIKLSENVGTAGSISLILQTIIPVSAICKKELDLSVIGGTDVLWSPTMDYTRYILGEAYARFGIDVSFDVIKRGYYPKGGGKVNVKVRPSHIKSVSLTKRKTKNLRLFCTFSKLPEKIIEQKINELKSRLEEKFSVETIMKKEEAIDPGSSLLIASIDDNSIIGIDSTYDKQNGGFDLDLTKITENNLGVDENLADMIVLPASLSNDLSIFCVPKISKHLETNLYVTSKITGCRYGVGKLRDGYEIRIEGTSHSGIQQ